MLKQEIWKDIVGYEGSYQVSNYGRVKSLQRKCKHSNGRDFRNVSEKIVTPVVQKNGYVYVTLSKNGVAKICRLHRIVALAFLENPNNLPEVNHKDENKQNNAVENLEWCSNYYNQNYGTHQERNAEHSKKAIIQYDLQGNFIKRWDSLKEAGIQLGIYSQNIGKCCKGKIHTAYGYIWKYAEDE